MRSIDQPYDHSRSHGCFLPSTRLISSRLKNRQRTSSPVRSRTSRIHRDVWYAHGHITSKWKSTNSIPIPPIVADRHGTTRGGGQVSRSVTSSPAAGGPTAPIASK